jgi:hypothetical protein
MIVLSWSIRVLIASSKLSIDQSKRQHKLRLHQHLAEVTDTRRTEADPFERRNCCHAFSATALSRFTRAGPSSLAYPARHRHAGMPQTNAPYCIQNFRTVRRPYRRRLSGVYLRAPLTDSRHHPRDARYIGGLAATSSQLEPPERNLIDLYADAGIEFIGISDQRRQN